MSNTNVSEFVDRWTLSGTSTPTRFGAVVTPVVPEWLVEPVSATESARFGVAGLLAVTVPAATVRYVYWFSSDSAAEL